MNINLHIERLVLDGLNIAPREASLVMKAVEDELTRLLEERGPAPNLRSGTALPDIRTNSIKVNGNANPLQTGREIARSVYSCIGENK